jgi:regulator of sigma E protease
MELSPVLDENRKSQVLGMIPRMKVLSVAKDSSAREAGVKKDDVILRIGTLNNPTISEFQDYCKSHEDKEVELLVARREKEQIKELTLQVTPQKPKISLWKRIFIKQLDPVIGVGVGEMALAAPVVAKCEKYLDDQGPLPIPRGATITAVAGAPVADWKEMINELVRHKGQEIEISYQTSPDQTAQSISMSLPDNTDWVGFAWRPDLGELMQLPLVPLKKLYKADNWVQSLQMGASRTYVFIAQTYLMIRGMIKRTVSPKSVSGPVGILKMSYNVVDQGSFIRYLYFMALISVCIAVFNFLPLPILDGGYIIMLIVEKIKGSPVSVKIQGIITYAGLILLLGFVIFVTYNDIIRVIKGQI